jgi:hypothetical protein
MTGMSTAVLSSHDDRRQPLPFATFAGGNITGPGAKTTLCA